MLVACCSLDETRTVILPELVELTNDEHCHVRLAGLDTVVNILSLLDRGLILVLITTSVLVSIVKHDSWPIQPDILSPPLLRLTSRKPLWLDLQLVDIKSR